MINCTKTKSTYSLIFDSLQYLPTTERGVRGEGYTVRVGAVVYVIPFAYTIRSGTPRATSTLSVAVV